jgi:GAF domain-containing protein
MGSSNASVFAEIALILDEAPNFDDTVEGVTRLAQENLACDFASVTLRHGRGNFETVAATHPDVEKADALQYQYGEGPCFEAAKQEGDFLSQDLENDPRWPTWGPEAARLGLNSLLGIRLSTKRETFGALNLYARDRRNFTGDDVELAAVFASHAAVALAASRNDVNLKRAIDSRHVIGQAQGLLMERFGIDVDRAFAVLRRLSQDGNVKLAVIAQQIVDERAGEGSFGSPAGPAEVPASSRV